jgi:hypothetical protein
MRYTLFLCGAAKETSRGRVSEKRKACRCMQMHKMRFSLRENGALYDLTVTNLCRKNVAALEAIRKADQ